MTALTARQADALRRVSHGGQLDQVADGMGISRSAVEKHLSAARKRLNAKTLAHAVYLATRAGIVTGVLIATFTAGTLGSVDVVRRSARQIRREQFADVRSIRII